MRTRLSPCWRRSRQASSWRVRFPYPPRARRTVSGAIRSTPAPAVEQGPVVVDLLPSLPPASSSTPFAAEAYGAFFVARNGRVTGMVPVQAVSLDEACFLARARRGGGGGRALGGPANGGTFRARRPKRSSLLAACRSGRWDERRHGAVRASGSPLPGRRCRWRRDALSRPWTMLDVPAFVGRMPTGRARRTRSLVGADQPRLECDLALST